MTLSLSIKNVPEELAAQLRAQAERNHRSLQGELMAILEAATGERNVVRSSPGAEYRSEEAIPARGLLDRLLAIAGNRGIDTSRRLTREQAHDREALRKTGV